MVLCGVCLFAMSLQQVLRFHVLCVAAGSKLNPLAVCYLRHAFALGEHYNSVVPAEAEADGVEEEDDFEEVISSS